MCWMKKIWIVFLTSEVNETVAEYYILRTEDGLDISYFIYFFKDANGKWRIDRF
jgi:hypothetical protein